MICHSSNRANSPTVSEQFSARPFPTLRRASNNPPPYFESCRAESLIKQGGESRHVRRRVSSNKAERVSTRGRRQSRRAGWGHIGGLTYFHTTAYLIIGGGNMEMVLPLFPRRGRGRMEIRQTVGFKRKNAVFPHIHSEGYFHGAWKNHFHAKVEEPPPNRA